MNSFNWQWWQYFLTLAESGSLSKAAILLGVSQPTLSRQLAAMEKLLGYGLFDRSTQGLTLTEYGVGFLEQAKVMRSASDKLQRLAHGQEQTLTGKVRISVNEMMAQHYLPPILPIFLNRYPNLSVEIEVSNKVSSLDKRDADVAIRMFAPTQPDLKARLLFNIPFGFYAHSIYLDKIGRPQNIEALFQHRVLGFDRDQQFINAVRAMGMELLNDNFIVRSDFVAMHLELAKQGGGIVATHKALCEKYGLEEILSDVEIPSLPVYLACHRDVQHNQKIRVMMDFLAEYLEQALTIDAALEKY